MEMLAFLSQKLRTLHIFVDGGKKDIEGAEERNLATCDDGALYNVHLGTNDEAPHEIYVDEGVWGVDDLVVTDLGDEERDDLGDGELGDNECYEGDVGDNERYNEELWDSDEDVEYVPSESSEDTLEETSEASLDDLELGSGDDEYVESRKKAASVRAQKLNLFDMCFGNGGVMNEPVYEVSDGDVNSSETDEDGDNILPRRKKNVYDPRCQHKNLEVKLGLRFQDGFECRDALTDWAIENGKFLKFRRVSKTQLEAKCGKAKCPWRVFASTVKADKTFMIKSYGGDHNCPRDMNNKFVSSKWIAKKYINVFRVKPNLSAKDLAGDILERLLTRVKKDRL